MKKQTHKKRRGNGLRWFMSILLLVLAIGCMAAMFFLGKSAFSKKSTGQSEVRTVKEEPNAESGGIEETDTVEPPDISASEEPTAAPTPSPEPTPTPATMMAGDVQFDGGFDAAATENTIVPDETDVLSTHSVLVDLSTDTFVAARSAEERISPASMTKILTVLVAAEQIENLDGTFTVTSDMTAYCLNNGCSAAGFVGGETVPIRDLFYGTILPSGGEAAVALATCAAGSHEAFVELMNQKLEELGLSDTAHFTNCVGLYDENHYCTVSDMAMILKAAVANDWAREVLSTKVHTTTVTEQNPEGIILSNWFLRRIEDKDCGGTVLCAKTGFVAQSGDCAASYEISASGKPYICVTVNAHSNWRCIYDHVAMYKLYAK